MKTVTVKKWGSTNKCQIYLDKVLFTEMDETRGLVLVFKELYGFIRFERLAFKNQFKGHE